MQLQFMQRRVTEKRNRAKKKRRKTNLAECSYSVGLTDCKRLNGTLVATLYCSFNFLVLVESPFT